MRLSGDASPTNKATGLLGLPLVIIRTIFDQVYHDDIEAFVSLSLLSKDCRRECERLLFRSLTINYKKIIATRGDLRILARLQDPEDTVAEHVRHLRIGPFTDHEYYNEAIAPAFERALPHLTKLQSLGWNSHLPLPLNILQDLYELCPSAQLHVTNRDRRFPVPLSRPLLSYPRLHTVDITAYYVLRREGPVYSELDILKTCLIHGGSVKVLRLGTISSQQGVPMGCNTDDDPGYALEHWEGVTAGPLNFHWREGDRFPPLEELKLDDRRYNLSLEQCKLWVKCMDWSKLRKLDVDKGAPRYLFEALMGEVPQLKSLTFGAWPNYDIGPQTWECQDMTTISKFLGSITALEEMVFNAFDYNDFMGTLPAIFEKSGCTLRRFHATCVGWNSKRWTENDFMALLDSCYKLTDLNLYLRFHTVEGHWPDKHVTARAKYESLIMTERQVPTGRTGDIRGM